MKIKLKSFVSFAGNQFLFRLVTGESLQLIVQSFSWNQFMYSIVRTVDSWKMKRSRNMESDTDKFKVAFVFHSLMN
jgi:hypothetical protein